MRYLTLAQALVIAEAVTGLEVATLAKASRLELLDAARHAPQAGFGDEDAAEAWIRGRIVPTG